MLPRTPALDPAVQSGSSAVPKCVFSVSLAAIVVLGTAFVVMISLDPKSAVRAFTSGARGVKRSEERRVGKECRGRWGRDNYSKKSRKEDGGEAAEERQNEGRR